jgi:hypothetical protein
MYPNVTYRVARFLLGHDTKTGKNVPNEQIMYQMSVKYSTCLKNISTFKALQNIPKLGSLV